MTRKVWLRFPFWLHELEVAPRDTLANFDNRQSTIEKTHRGGWKNENINYFNYKFYNIINSISNNSNVNNSKEHFFPKDGVLYFGLNEIKGVGEEPAKIIVKNQPYTSVIDFICKNIDEKGIEPDYEVENKISENEIKDNQEKIRKELDKIDSKTGAVTLKIGKSSAVLIKNKQMYAKF